MILDTSALSAFADGDPELQKVLMSEPTHQLPAIVLGEYRFGLQASRLRIARERWLDERESDFIVLSVDAQTARCYALARAELKALGSAIPENDLWIVALAVQHGHRILTRDIHFSNVPGVTAVSW